MEHLAPARIPAGENSCFAQEAGESSTVFGIAKPISSKQRDKPEKSCGKGLL